MENKELTINSSTDITLIDNHFYEIKIVLKDCIDVNIKLTENTKATMSVNVVGSGKLNLHTSILSNSNLTALYWNDCEDNCDIDEVVDIYENSTYTIAYGDLNETTLKRTTEYQLKGENAKVETRTATIASKHKEIVQHTEHLHPLTFSNMINYAIALEEADLFLKVTGHIIKGARGSEAYQTSRVLTLGEKQKTVVLPELLIDENDVQAGHAMTMGQVDENQLYYMQSRGLDRNEAMRLITLGYLLPIVDIIVEQSLKERLENTIKEKVNQICWT